MTSCDFTTASRIRRGDRRPSLALMARMWKSFQLDGNAVFAAYLRGRDAFTEYLNAKIFDPAEGAETGPDRCPNCGRPDVQS